MGGGLPAAVVVAHDDPPQVRRLLAALAPLRVFLHVDANSSDEVARAILAGQPERVVALPRIRSGWAHRGILDAEIMGYRAALAETDAEHIVLCTGADYPLQSTRRIVELLDRHRGLSFGDISALPIEHWGPLRGYDRFIAKQFAWRQHRIPLPAFRRIPHQVVPAGGAQNKILSRRHAQLVVDALVGDDALRRFFRTCWIPDEVAIPSILFSPLLGGDWLEASVPCQPLWHINWGRRPGVKPPKSPRWLAMSDLPAIREAASRPGIPALFARKFSSSHRSLVEAIDAELRTET